jgi:hypothetical protein
MPNSTVWLRTIAALAGAIIVAIPLSAQARCTSGIECRQPAGPAKVSTIYRYHTVQKVSDVNRYRNVTRTSYHDITRTKYHDVHRIKYADVTRTHYVRHINRVVNIKRVQPMIRVHTVTLVHHRIIARVHTQVIAPRPCRGDTTGALPDRGSASESVCVRNEIAADPHSNGRAAMAMIRKSVAAGSASVTCLDSIGVDPARSCRIDALVGH